MCPRKFLAFSVALLATVASPASAQDFEVEGDQVRVLSSIEFHHPETAINFAGLYPSSLTLFKAKVEGQDICAFLDTGASNTILSREFAEFLQLESVQSLGQAETAGGQIEGFLTRAVQLEVPEQFVREASIVVTPMPDITCPDGLKLGLAIGRDMLDEMVVFVDNPNQQISFVPHGRLNPKQDRHLRIDWVDEHVDAEIENKPARMFLDTGANVPIVINETVFETYFSGRNRQSAAAATSADGVETNISKIEGVSLEIAGIEVAVDAYIRPENQTSAPLILGNSVFKSNPAIFDLLNEVVYLLPRGATQ